MIVQSEFKTPPRPLATSIAGSRNIKMATPVLPATSDIPLAHALICVGIILLVA